MRILLDEMVSRNLARALIGHQVSTVPREGWAGITNGALLDSLSGRAHLLAVAVEHRQAAGQREMLVQLPAQIGAAGQTGEIVRQMAAHGADPRPLLALARCQDEVTATDRQP